MPERDRKSGSFLLFAGQSTFSLQYDKVPGCPKVTLLGIHQLNTAEKPSQKRVMHPDEQTVKNVCTWGEKMRGERAVNDAFVVPSRIVHLSTLSCLCLLFVLNQNLERLFKF